MQGLDNVILTTPTHTSDPLHEVILIGSHFKIAGEHVDTWQLLSSEVGNVLELTDADTCDITISRHDAQRRRNLLPTDISVDPILVKVLLTVSISLATGMTMVFASHYNVRGAVIAD